jgi:hypothetical protein
MQDRLRHTEPDLRRATLPTMRSGRVTDAFGWGKRSMVDGSRRSVAGVPMGGAAGRSELARIGASAAHLAHGVGDSMSLLAHGVGACGASGCVVESGRGDTRGYTGGNR